MFLDVVDSRRKAVALDEDIRGLVSMRFPEGKRIEKMHKARERNRKVIQLAKREYAKKHKGEFTFLATQMRLPATRYLLKFRRGQV